MVYQSLDYNMATSWRQGNLGIYNQLTPLNLLPSVPALERQIPSTDQTIAPLEFNIGLALDCPWQTGRKLAVYIRSWKEQTNVFGRVHTGFSYREVVLHHKNIYPLHRLVFKKDERRVC